MDLNKLRKDIEEGIKQGIVIVEKGVALVKVKAGELTEEGKKQYRMYELKTKMQKEVSVLGAKVCQLSAAGAIKPVHEDVRKIIARIDKLQTSLAKLAPVAAKKPAAKKKAPVKKSAPAPKAPVKKAVAAKKPAAKKKTAPAK
jgi:hypothetical protein